jgi:hypothetical protein
MLMRIPLFSTTRPMVSPTASGQDNAWTDTLKEILDALEPYCQVPATGLVTSLMKYVMLLSDTSTTKACWTIMDSFFHYRLLEIRYQEL